MEQFQQIIGTLTGYIWGPWMIISLVGIGVYFTIGTKFLQIRKFPFIIKQTLGRFFDKESEIEGEGTLIPRQAASAALSSTVGVGNIVGVATALVLGGPGAIFWMWFSALFGMCTKYAEIVLSIAYRKKDKEGNFLGGPAWYMKEGLKSPFLATIFTVSLAIVCLGGNMVQSNAIAETVDELFGISPGVIGVILLIGVGIVSIGGVKRLGKVTEKLVPAMTLLYIGGGIIVILANISNLPSAISSIFTGAFSSSAVGGGVAGFAVMEAIKYGIARGLYSNEAGMGTAPIAHATAKTDHPARQGMWGVTEVFIDTFIIGTLTALTILTSGVLGSDASPAVLASLAYGTVFPGLKYIVGISLILFAYSTIITISYYGESLARYIGGEKLGKFYRYFFLPFTLIGSIGGLQMIWSIVDLLMGIGVIPNLIAILLLSPKVFKLTNEFFGSGQKNKPERSVPIS
ncbi:AGCS family alanine or glycine:cation symporter [Caldalkalibacillus uzonensis]|uniref:AGCS family alanine or glycine:cation symporter n=1 Tax=Caldalkalibacillus uzonensis TaxID=353224 RepID=A0ABU0CNP9_9BACI|nr:sodium:alanine symporter family protein [Caldalkalibacillus uzonensis]MDQ0338034.1 AGCS family alanine or glycine:cation symporter [Caldalkalibacillus uzonensis]